MSTAQNKEKSLGEITGLFRELLRMMVDCPDAIKLRSDSENGTVAFTVRVSATDTRRVIGRGAQNHKALAMVLRMAGEQYGLNVLLKQIEEPLPADATDVKHVGLDAKNIESLLRETVSMCLGCGCQLYYDKRGEQTRIKAVVERDQDPYKVILLADAMLKIFRCIGQKHGTELDVVLALAGEPAQPKSAAGRFSGEVKR